MMSTTITTALTMANDDDDDDDDDAENEWTDEQMKSLMFLMPNDDEHIRLDVKFLFVFPDFI